MKRFVIPVMALLMVGLLLFGGCLVPKSELDKKDEQIAQLQTEKKQWVEVGEPAAEATGYQNAEKDLGMTVEEAKAKLDYLASLSKPLRDPTLEELDALLARYEVKLTINYPEVMPWEFAQAFQEYAQKEGFQCGIVRLALLGDHTTFINVLDIPGLGLTYVEPQAPLGQHPKIVTVKVGERYFVPNGWHQPDYDDTITKIIGPSW